MSEAIFHQQINSENSEKQKKKKKTPLINVGEIYSGTQTVKELFVNSISEYKKQKERLKEKENALKELTYKIVKWAQNEISNAENNRLISSQLIDFSSLLSYFPSVGLFFFYYSF